GAVSPPKKVKRVPERLAAIADGLAETIREHRPDLAAVERAFFGKSATAALRVGEARGVALAELARAGVRVEELTPAEVKRAVTGTGGARKQQVQLMVGAILGCEKPIEPLDASDALALAVCLAHRVTANGNRRWTQMDDSESERSSRNGV
ncbi:MAG: crossover junction endodeoxyribonuclease RuvC, partial [Planctomycetota bacterium]